MTTLEKTFPLGHPSKPFDYTLIPDGYYDHVMRTGNPMRRAWHIQKFERILDCLPHRENMSLLDIGCFAGTFLSTVPEERFKKQLGVDILQSQVLFAKQHFKTPFRDFAYIRDFSDLNAIDGEFDCVTLIEVIEHLDVNDIRSMFECVIPKIKIGGRLLLSTPNYASSWPLLELLVNTLSDVSYAEQHLTKFNYFNAENKLQNIYPQLKDKFDLDFRTTTHFVTPFLAMFSLNIAGKLSRVFPHRDWHFPFGNLLLLSLARK
jgi:2-polyprenyl-3-methyl-5-hydroxy-6-metoxy-1,4-benzoquinol methylase